MLVEYIIIGVVIAAAVALAVWRAWRTLSGKRKSCCDTCVTCKPPAVVRSKGERLKPANTDHNDAACCESSKP